MMTTEEMDYKLSRLKPAGSCTRMGDTWAYLDSKGTLHQLENRGYYFAWKCNMWASCYWSNEGHWILGTISYSKKGLIKKIENEVKKGNFLEWNNGFGKRLAIEEDLL